MEGWRVLSELSKIYGWLKKFIRVLRTLRKYIFSQIDKWCYWGNEFSSTEPWYRIEAESSSNIDRESLLYLQPFLQRSRHFSYLSFHLYKWEMLRIDMNRNVLNNQFCAVWSKILDTVMKSDQGL